MSDEIEECPFEEDNPPGVEQARARAAEWEIRQRIREVFLLCRRKDGRILHECSVLARVTGATLALVRAERAYLERAGLLVETLVEDECLREGKTT